MRTSADNDSQAQVSDGLSASAVVVCFIVLMIPLIFDRSLFDQWELPKATFLWLISGLALFVWSTERLIKNDRRLVLPGAVGRFVIAFLVVASLSAAFSVQSLRSLYGDIGRHEGLLTIISYTILFFISMQVLSSRTGLRLLVRSIALMSLIVSAYGLIQILGFDPIAWPSGRFESYRSFSTLGNPMFLGELLALSLPVVFGGMFVARGRERFFFGISAAVTAACLVTTFTRGSWLGGALGLLVILPHLIKGVDRKRLIAGLALTMAAGLLFAGVLTFSGKLPAKEIADRLASTFSSGEGSGATRIEIWKASLSMVAARPVIGWGPDSYRLVYPKYATLNHYRIAGRNIVADNAHNYPLQLATSVGILGTLLYIAIILLALRRIRRLSVFDLLIVGLGGGVIGYLIALFFGISIVAASAVLWIVLGALAGFARQPSVYKQILPESEGKRILLERARPGIFAVNALLLILAFSWLVRPYLADRYYARALSAAEQKRPIEMVDALFVKASEYAPYEEQYLLGSGFYYSSLAKIYRKKELYLEAADRFFLVQEASPLETNGYTFLATTFLDLAKITGNDDYKESAIEQLIKEIELAPNFAPGYYLLGSTLKDLGDYRGAIEVLKKSIEKDPNYREAWLSMADAYKLMGEEPLAEAAYKKAESLSEK